MIPQRPSSGALSSAVLSRIPSGLSTTAFCLCLLSGAPVRAGDALEVVERNPLGEGIYATPAIVDNTLYIRSDQHLWAFAE